MAPSKQAARKEAKQSKKVDDEPAVASTSSQAAILAAGKQLVNGSILLEVGQQLPQLLKKGSTTSLESKPTPEGTEGEESVEPDTSSNQSKSADSDSTLDKLTQRISIKNPLGIDQAPEESWEMFTSQEWDFGPHKRKKGNPAMERMMVNVERNMAQYLHILLFLMCVRSVLLRSWFSCLPWLVLYQFISMYAPVDSLRESIPQAAEKVPPIEAKHRVVATMIFHLLIWIFFLFEFGYQTYIFEKILIILLLAAHSYMVAPVIDPEAARKRIAARNKEEAPTTEAAASAGAKVNWGKVKEHVKDSVIFKRTKELPGLVKEIQASAKKAAPAEGKKEGEEKTEEKTEGETNDKTTSGTTSTFVEIQGELSPFNMLGLGKSHGEAKESWNSFKKEGMKFSKPAQKKGAAKERIVTNAQKFSFQYINILLALMCLRAFVFRSWFACLPLLVVSQLLSLKLPLEKVDHKVRSVVTLSFHILVWAAFVYETAFTTNVGEKLVLVGMFIGHMAMTEN